MTIPASHLGRFCRIRTGSTRILCRFARITAPARIAFAICIGATFCFAIASTRAGRAGINSGAVRVVVEPPVALPSCRADLTIKVLHAILDDQGANHVAMRRAEVVVITSARKRIGFGAGTLNINPVG